MFIRTPSQQPLANSNARLALLLRSPGGMRVVEIGDRTLTAIILITAALLAWYLFATLYLVLRDDIVVSLVTGQRRQHYAYEDRIADLRSKIDRMTARQVVNQDTIEDRVSHLVARQAELEARQIMVADISTRATQAGISPTHLRTNEAISAFEASFPITTGTIGGPVLLEKTAPSRPTPLDAASPDSVSPARDPKGFESLKMRGALQGVVNEVEQRSERMERGQLNTLRSIADIAQGTIARGREAIASTGLNPSRFGRQMQASNVQPPAPPESFALRNIAPGSQPTSAMGGPYIPVTAQGASELFERHISQAEGSLRDAAHARSILRTLPIGRPLGSQHDITSSFGTRVDPFTRGYALHSGIDFRAPTGTAVRAVSGGKIIESGMNGGYGRMVEIDHGFGISTRYAHLSLTLVKEGDVVAKGAVIGQVGSTGRSTGPHLHYEVRVDEGAMDPMRFVRAGRLIGTTP